MSSRKTYSYEDLSIILNCASYVTLFYYKKKKWLEIDYKKIVFKFFLVMKPSFGLTLHIGSTMHIKIYKHALIPSHNINNPNGLQSYQNGLPNPLKTHLQPLIITPLVKKRRLVDQNKLMTYTHVLEWILILISCLQNCQHPKLHEVGQITLFETQPIHLGQVLLATITRLDSIGYILVTRAIQRVVRLWEGKRKRWIWEQGKALAMAISMPRGWASPPSSDASSSPSPSSPSWSRILIS